MLNIVSIISGFLSCSFDFKKSPTRCLIEVGLFAFSNVCPTGDWVTFAISSKYFGSLKSCLQYEHLLLLLPREKQAWQCIARLSFDCAAVVSVFDSSVACVELLEVDADELLFDDFAVDVNEKTSFFAICKYRTSSSLK